MAEKSWHPTAHSRLRRLARPTLIIFALLLFLLVDNLPTPKGLTPQGQKAIAIFAVSIFLWVTHALPLMITSLLVVILFPLSGVLSTRESYSLFGNEAIFFILGAFILASGIMRSGLSTRLALMALRKFGQSTHRLLLGFLCLSAFLSFWMSSHAVAAMMFPIVFEVVDALKLVPLKSRYAKGLFLAMTWGTIIGGVATFLGGARAPLAIGILQQTTGHSIDFIRWAIAALPTVLTLTVAGYLVLIKWFSPDVENIKRAVTALQKKRLAMGPMTQKEKSIGLLMLLTIVAWIGLGERFGLANIAIASVVIAFVFKLLDWREVEEDVNWGIFLMYGGAICLGFAMEMTGAAHWTADKALGSLVHSSWGLILILSFVSLFMTEAISNTAVVALIMPLALAFAADVNVDPRLVTLATTIPSGLAFHLPMGTPATALAISSGFVGLRDTITSGLIMNVLAWSVFVLSIYFFWPLIGFKL